MSIPLVESTEVKAHGGHGKGHTKGEKYGKYAIAISPHLPWLKENIDTSKDGYIRIKTTDIAEAMKIPKKSDTAIYWGLKYVLFNEGIVVETATHKDNSQILTMRFATTEDRLPPSLSKYIDKEDKDLEEPDTEDTKDED